MGRRDGETETENITQGRKGSTIEKETGCVPVSITWKPSFPRGRGGASAGPAGNCCGGRAIDRLIKKRIKKKKTQQKNKPPTQNRNTPPPKKRKPKKNLKQPNKKITPSKQKKPKKPQNENHNGFRKKKWMKEYRDEFTKS